MEPSKLNGLDNVKENDFMVLTKPLQMSPGERRKQMLAESNRIGVHSFTFLKVIGKGSFGKVS